MNLAGLMTACLALITMNAATLAQDKYRPAQPAPGRVVFPTAGDHFSGNACATSSELDAHLRQLYEAHKSTRADRQAFGAAPVAELGGLIVLEDDGQYTADGGGDVWDLTDSTLQFQPVAGLDGFFDATRTALNFDPQLGELATTWVGQWGQHSYALPFSFPFGTEVIDTLYITSDIGIFFASQTASGGGYQYGQAEIDLGVPRIAPLLRKGPWTWARILDLYIKEEPDTVTITWHEQTHRPWSCPDLDRYLQVKLGDDGNISMSYPEIHPFNTYGYVQLIAPGPDGAPDVTDLSTLGAGVMQVRRAYQAFTFPELLPQAVETTLTNQYGFDETTLDGIMIYQNYYTDITFYAGAYHTQGNPGASGIGKSVNLAISLMHMNYIGLSHNLRDARSMIRVLSHEFGHRWLYFVDGVGDSRSGAHPAMNAHHTAPFTWFSEDDSSCMGGSTWTDNGDNTFSTPSVLTNNSFSWNELYLMGLADPAEVDPWWYVGDNIDLEGPYYPPVSSTFSGTRVDLDIDDIITANGARDPAWPDTQRDFRLAFVLLTRPQNPLQAEELVDVRHKMRIWQDTWVVSVDHRASVHTELAEILASSVPDCNFNGVADDQDIAAGTSTDCNGNGIPGECEEDCNGNCIDDATDITAGTSEDCDGNLVPDECVPAGLADCNDNLTPDLCDVFSGNSSDINHNIVPDECECLADVDGDGTVNVVDLLVILSEWGACIECAGDVDRNTVTSITDLLLALSGWGPCP